MLGEECVGVFGTNCGGVWLFLPCHYKACSTFSLSHRSIIKVTGEVMFSFPLGYVSQFASHAPLRFVVSEARMVTRLIHNQNYLIK